MLRKVAFAAGVVIEVGIKGVVLVLVEGLVGWVPLSERLVVLDGVVAAATAPDSML